MVFAIYDEWGRVVRTGFETPDAATTWLTAHPVLDVYDAQGEYLGSGASAYEAELLGGTARPRPRTRFDILPVLS